MTDLSFSKIKIDGFRNLRNLELNGLGRINILVGGNNIGKTSILEAVSILCHPCAPTEWLSLVNRRDYGELDENRLQSLKWCFKQPTHPFRANTEDLLFTGSCSFSSDGLFSLRSLNVAYEEFFGQPDITELSGIMRSVVESLQDSRGLDAEKFALLSTRPSFATFNGDDTDRNYTIKIWTQKFFNSFRPDPDNDEHFLRCETLSPYSYQINKAQVRKLSENLRDQDQDKDKSIALLKDFDPDIEGLEIASFYGDRPAIYIQHKKLGLAPLSTFGDAMRRIVLWSMTIPSLKDGGILLMDEVEAGIHTTTLSKVFPWLVASAKQFNIQVFVTTHSLEALDALIASSDSTSENDIVAFHLDQTDTKTEVKRFSGDLLNRLRFERGLDLR